MPFKNQIRKIFKDRESVEKLFNCALMRCTAEGLTALIQNLHLKDRIGLFENIIARVHADMSLKDPQRPLNVF